jgi:hypothetical protein
MSDLSPDDYELAVFAKIRLDFQSTAVRVEGTEHGVKHYVIGRYSLVKRQLDVAAYRPEETRPFFIADAKRHGNTLDVKDAEAFIGMVDDVGASMSLLVAPKGFTPAAVRRARAASTSVLIMTLEEALTYRWLPLAREIYPYDWIFHEELACALRLLYERAQPEAMMDALESVSFEEWDLLVGYALARHPDQARCFLLAVAQYHHDDGWRFNAVRHLMEANMLDKELCHELLQRESDPDTIELLENSLGDR